MNCNVKTKIFHIMILLKKIIIYYREIFNIRLNQILIFNSEF